VNNTGTKRQHYEINGILMRKKGECATCLKIQYVYLFKKYIKNVVFGG
jgi:hypothetical protein